MGGLLSLIGFLFSLTFFRINLHTMLTKDADSKDFKYMLYNKAPAYTSKVALSTFYTGCDFSQSNKKSLIKALKVLSYILIPVFVVGCKSEVFAVASMF